MSMLPRHVALTSVLLALTVGGFAQSPQPSAADLAIEKPDGNGGSVPVVEKEVRHCREQ